MNLPLKVKMKVILLTLLNMHLNNNIRSEPIQIFKHYCLKKQLIRMPTEAVLYWLHLQKNRKPKKYPKKGKKAAPKLVVNQNATKHALLADETATTSGEEHVASPPKVSKAKAIPEKGQKAEPKRVARKRVIPQKASALCDGGAMAFNSDMDV